MNSAMERPSQPVYQAPAAPQQPERDVPRPHEGVTNRPQPMMQQAPQFENQREYPMPQRPIPQPSYSAPSAPQQQTQLPQSRPTPAQPAPLQRASQPAPRPATSNGNSHAASSFQGGGHEKVQQER
jgi:hypothetical protein